MPVNDPVPANDPGGTRTHDLAVKSRVLYQLSYRVGLTGTRRHPKRNLAATARRRNRAADHIAAAARFDRGTVDADNLGLNLATAGCV